MSTDIQAILTDLLGRVGGLQSAIVLDSEGIPIVQAGEAPGVDLEAAGAGASLLLRDTLAVAERLGQGRIGEVLLEAERMTLAMIPLKNACSLCLLLDPGVTLGRSLFEARRTAYALDQSL